MKGQTNERIQQLKKLNNKKLKTMANKSAKEIIGDEEFNNLRTDLMDELCNEDASPLEMMDNIEDLMLDYGLEMDYIFDVIGY